MRSIAVFLLHLHVIAAAGDSVTTIASTSSHK
jgi:hypothetical protein